MYSGLGAYYLKNGQPATVLYVGDVMGFNVPGYSQVWLDQTQNGAPQYSGPFNLPMSPYTLQARDIGTFQASVYELTQGGTKGKLIGTDSIQVQAATAPKRVTCQQRTSGDTVSVQDFDNACPEGWQPWYAGTPPPTVQQIAAPGYVNPSTTPSGTAILSTGIATPSAPAPSTTSIYYQPGPALETGAPTDEAPAESGGFSSGAILAIAGLGLLILFSGRGRR